LPVSTRAGASPSSWDEERIARLCELWREGRSAAEIARALGGVTRSAVLGKLHRLGLARGRDGGEPAGRPARRSPAPAATPKRRRLPPPIPARPAPEAELPGLCRLVELPRRACRWPIGDPMATDFRFCGRASSRGAYCEVHARLAYRPAGRRLPPDHLLKLAGLA
jgi:GcrA cell cycle regulator